MFCFWWNHIGSVENGHSITFPHLQPDRGLLRSVLVPVLLALSVVGLPLKYAAPETTFADMIWVLVNPVSAVWTSHQQQDICSFGSVKKKCFEKQKTKQVMMWNEHLYSAVNAKVICLKCFSSCFAWWTAETHKHQAQKVLSLLRD